MIMIDWLINWLVDGPTDRSIIKLWTFIISLVDKNNSYYVPFNIFSLVLCCWLVAEWACGHYKVHLKQFSQAFFWMTDPSPNLVQLQKSWEIKPNSTAGYCL